MLKEIALVLCIGLSAAGQVFAQPGEMKISDTLVMETEEGNIRIVLFTRQAPVTCANFLQYIDRVGAAGGTFYRTVTLLNQPGKAVKIEVIQGGFNLDGLDTGKIQNIPLERTTHTGLAHHDGTLSMARNGPDTGSTEFFICIGEQPSLDFGGLRNPDGQGFAAFGQVISGMDVVRKIQNRPADGQSLTPPVRIFNIIHAKGRNTPGDRTSFFLIHLQLSPGR
jgi:peptidyl-prolyl cis-trans isomerase A (cyclophilin A)